jgi:uncharacterized protein YfcZ (UPF0381/DUF406 family)
MFNFKVWRCVVCCCVEMAKKYSSTEDMKETSKQQINKRERQRAATTLHRKAHETSVRSGHISPQIFILTILDKVKLNLETRREK